jgi:CheY-like chemotaxis protein
MRQTVGPAITIEVALKDGCWPVKCDPNQLENALLNLAINARDAMDPHGGHLIIGTEHFALDTRDVAGFPGARPGDFVRVTVSDTGSGMAADVLEHAFEPFFTTKPAGQGTGLGLSQVFGFVSQSNGIIRIDSQVGQGTSVHLFLPRGFEPVERETDVNTEPADSISLLPATVLLVEDEAGIRQLGAEALRDAGCVVLEAQDGQSGLNTLRTELSGNARGVSILVTDVGLPGGLNGRQLADAAREIAPNLPILLITGYAGEALANGIQEDAGMELMTKPFALDALAARVRAMLVNPSKKGEGLRTLSP